MRVISLGWGVQSFTLAAMSALGELQPVDVAIHADTTHERTSTYEFVAQWTPWLAARNVQVVTVNDAKAAQRVWKGEMIPAYSYGPVKRAIYGDTDDDHQVTDYVYKKTKGQALRTCTDRWKIAPMRRWLQENRHGEQVEQWIGISMDEIQRIRTSNVKYIVNRYPLVEKRMTRADCERWLIAHNLQVPPKSACYFCPFHSKSAWRELKTNAPGDFKRAIAVDEAIRGSRPPVKLYLHSSAAPLAVVDMRTQQEKGQLDLFTQDECSGMCFI